MPVAYSLYIVRIGPYVEKIASSYDGNYYMYNQQEDRHIEHTVQETLARRVFMLSRRHCCTASQMNSDSGKLIDIDSTSRSDKLCKVKVDPNLILYL